MEERIGQYKIVSELGRGGMGVVYKGYDDSLKRFVAIKVLPPHLSQEKSFIARFVREAQSAAMLNHPNIVQIHAIGEDQGANFFVMEFVEGQSIQQILRDGGRMQPLRATQMVLQAASGLAAAHDHGVVHRDIKPANIMVTPRDLVKIADFGLAFLPEEASRLTATGHLVGTPGYLSPEQCMASDLDLRTDIYSLGITWYEMLTGTMPFRADSPFAMVRKVVEVVPPDVTTLNPEVDAELGRFLAKMIAKRREDRYVNCHDLAAELENYLASRGALLLATGRATAVPVPVRVPASSPDNQATARVSRAETAAAPVETPTVDLVRALVPQSTPATGPAVAAAAAQPPALPAPPLAAKKQPLVLVAILVVLLIVSLAAGAAAIVFGRTFIARLTGRTSPVASAQRNELATAPAKTDENAPATGSSASVVPASAQEAKVDLGSAPPSTAAAPGTLPAPDAALPADAKPITIALNAPATAAPAEAEAGLRTGGDAVERTAPSRTAANLGRGSSPESTAPAVASAAQTRPGSLAHGAPPVVTERPAAPVPLKPLVVVVGAGDPEIATALETKLGASLREAGFDLVDADNDPALNDLHRRRGDAPDLAELLPALRAHDIGVVVMARAEPLGNRQLNYLGRSETAYTARIKVNAFLVPNRKAIGSGWQEKIEYTSLNLDRQTEKSLESMAGELPEAIRAGWARYRSE